MEKAEKWARLLVEQKRSGKSVAEFCKERGVTEGSFQYWRTRLGKKEQRSFVRVGAPSPVEVELLGGVRVMIPTDIGAEELKKVLEAVSAVSC